MFSDMSLGQRLQNITCATRKKAKEGKNVLLVNKGKTQVGNMHFEMHLEGKEAFCKSGRRNE